MSTEEQTRFQERVFKFIESKQFIGREGLIVTDEMRVLISASAIQLTFGLSNYLIKHLHSINIFPHSFYSKLFSTSFKGLTTQGGVLSISWDNFQEGYENETDKINLGLHELAHALNIDADEEANYDEHFFDCFQKWKTAALEDFLKLKEGKITFLRKYGSANMHEFFAVCIEHFFESANEFKKELPILYGHTALLLNQDTNNPTDDYRIINPQLYFIKKNTPINCGNTLNNLYTIIEESYPQEKSWQVFIRSKGIYVAMGATAFGLFIGLPLLFWFFSKTIISIGATMLLFFCCGTLGLIQWKYVKKLLDMEYHQFSMYAYTGFGMCLINLLLFLNYIIPINTHTETYGITSIKYHNQNFEITLQGKNNSNALENSLGNYFENNDIHPSEKMVTITFETGLLGFDIIRDCEFFN